MSWKKVFNWAASLMVPIVALVAVLLFYKDAKVLLSQSLRFDYRYLFVSLLLQWSGYSIAFLIWRRILATFEIRLPFVDDLKFFVYSSIGWIIPGSVWPFLMRPALYQKKNADSLTIIAATFIETLCMGIGAFFLYTVITLFKPSMSLWQNPYIGAALLAVSIGFLHPKIFNRLLAFVYKLTRKGEHPPSGKFDYWNLLLWMSFQALVVVIGGISEFYLLKSFIVSQPVWIFTVITAWAVGTAAGSIIFAFPGASIIKDGAMTVILSTVLTVPVALLFVVLARLWSMFFIMLGAGFTWVVLEFPGWLKGRKHGNTRVIRER